LDTKGLGALWREALLAQAVLMNKTKGWKNHPQLERFKGHQEPLSAIGYYLIKIYDEATKRGYRYNRSKIIRHVEYVTPIIITIGQLEYELEILMERLKQRAPSKYAELYALKDSSTSPKAHSIFNVIKGDIEPWETSYWKRLRHP
jgi:hypothetical protein